MPEHAELAWILNCSTSMGKLQRMTTWKVRPFPPRYPSPERRLRLNTVPYPPPLALVGLQGKIAVHKNHASEADVSESDLNLGLFAYPVLQAADILLYKLRLLPFPSSFPPPSFPPED